jgi:hypothetical protein
LQPCQTLLDWVSGPDCCGAANAIDCPAPHAALAWEPWPAGCSRQS